MKFHVLPLNMIAANHTRKLPLNMIAANHTRKLGKKRFFANLTFYNQKRKQRMSFEKFTPTQF